MADRGHQSQHTTQRYDRIVLVEILIYHARTATAGCQCGWAELGKSHPEHVADIYEQSIAARAA